jgi:hypothetical protein
MVLVNNREDLSNKPWRTNRPKHLNFIATPIQSRRWAHIKRSFENLKTWTNP